MAQPASQDAPAPAELPPESPSSLLESEVEQPGELELVFVYGTLKRGERNHHWLAHAGWRGEAELHGVVLHDLGPFPMAVLGPGRISGEVYGVDERGLARLDELEGYPRLYDRQRRSLNDGRLAWVYLGRPRQVRHAPVVKSGLWRSSNQPVAQPAE